MRRRDVIRGMGAAAASMPDLLLAQSQPVLLRVGAASPQTRKSPTSFLVPFGRRMAELGYVEGKNYEFDFVQVSAPNRFNEAIHDLVRRKVDVILAFGAEAPLRAALAQTRTIPIVMVAIDYDPLALHYIKSLARPGGNVTGLFLEQITLAKKRIDLLKEAFPATRAATVFWDALSAEQWRATRESAGAFGLNVVGIELRNYPYDFEAALAQAPNDHRGFLIPMTSPYFAASRQQLVRFTVENRIAAMFVFREYVDAGGLMSYGPSRTRMARRAADYINRIARGAKPSDLPVELPTTFELVINLKTAKMLGLAFSQAMLLRADDVIE
jgi:putative ABC transport system substrate-binding protein